jgi:hypothetical protein
MGSIQLDQTQVQVYPHSKINNILEQYPKTFFFFQHTSCAPDAPPC